MPEAMSFDEVAAAHPDCEIVRVRHYDTGFEACLMIPRDKIALATHPPFWRHGETLAIYPINP